MHLLRSHRFKDVQVPQVLMNLIFTDSGRDFAPWAPILLTSHSRGVETEKISTEDWNTKFVELLSLLLIQFYQFPSLVYQGVTPFLTFLSWLPDLKTFLSFTVSLARFSSGFAFLSPSQHNQISSRDSSQVTWPCFHCLCISCPFGVTSRSLLSHPGLLFAPSLVPRYHWLWCSMEDFPKDLPTLLCSPVPEYSFPGDCIYRLTEELKFVLLKFRGLTSVPTWPPGVWTPPVQGGCSPGCLQAPWIDNIELLTIIVPRELCHPLRRALQADRELVNLKYRKDCKHIWSSTVVLNQERAPKL